MSDYLANLVQMQPNIYQRELYNTAETHTTNADRLRAMSDEELADWVWGAESAGRAYGPRGKNAWLDWLREEARDASD